MRHRSCWDQVGTAPPVPSDSPLGIFDHDACFGTERGDERAIQKPLSELGISAAEEIVYMLSILACHHTVCSFSTGQMAFVLRRFVKTSSATMHNPKRLHPLTTGIHPLLTMPKVDTRIDTNDTVHKRQRQTERNNIPRSIPPFKPSKEAQKGQKIARGTSYKHSQIGSPFSTGR